MPLNFPELRIASRKSKLALLQAEIVKKTILKIYPNQKIKIITYQTSGDKIQNKPLFEEGGKGLFCKELELALIKKKVDLAVHSMKDVPGQLEEKLIIPAVLKRENPLDAIISKNNIKLSDLKENSRIGTSSPRRAAQIKNFRKDLQIIALRGNVETRLNKLKTGKLDAIILAVAGLKRLSLQDCISEVLPDSICLPAVAQGIIGIECLKENKNLIDYLTPINHQSSYFQMLAERSFLATLQGNCNSPIAAYSQIKTGKLFLQGLVTSLSGEKICKSQVQGSLEQSTQLGVELANQLIQRGALSLIKTP